MLPCGNGYCVGPWRVEQSTEQGHVQFLKCQSCSETSHHVVCRCGSRIAMQPIAISQTFMMETWQCQACKRQAQLTWADLGKTIQSLTWHLEPQQDPPVSPPAPNALDAFAELDGLVEERFAAVPDLAVPAAGQITAQCREYHRETGEMSSAGPYARSVLLFTIDMHPRLGPAERVMRICAMPIRILERHIPHICRSLTFETKAHWQTPGTFDPEKEHFVFVREYPVAIRLVVPRERVPEPAAN